MAADRAVTTELSRDLSLFHLTMMGLGMMIGAGVFLGIGNSIHVAGPGGVLLTFALNGLLALFTAMSYAELSSAIPRAGGAYNFARIAFGREISFMAGWMEWFASSVAGSMYAITVAIYTMRYFEQIGLLDWLPSGWSVAAIKALAVLVALLFVLINYRGASETGRIGAIMTLGQTLFLVAIGVVGIVVAGRDPSRLTNFHPFLPYGWSRLLMTMGFTYVAFEGFEGIAQAGDEAIEPRKNLPKAMIYSVFFAGTTYVLVGFATVIAVKAGSPGIDLPPWEWIAQFRERGFGEAVARLLPMGNFLLTLAVIFAATSALNATVYSATRAAYALGRDRMLPAFFARISRLRKTPSGALLITSVIIVIVAAFLPTLDVASSASIMFLFLFFLINVTVIKVRLNMGDELRYGFIMPLFPLFPLTALVCQAVLAVWLVHMSWVAWIVAPLWLIGGLFIYTNYSKSRVVATDDEILVLEEEPDPEDEGSEDARSDVIIPIANPVNALSLVRNTIRLCGPRHCRVQLLHMVPAPAPVTLSDAQGYMTEGREGIVEAMLYLYSRFPVTTTFRYCRNIARGIVSATKEKRTDLLIMGWRGGGEDRRYRLGSTVDPVISGAPCDVVVMKDCGNKVFRRVLVTIFGDRNDRLALETAGLLVDQEEGHITTLHLKRQGRRDKYQRHVQHLMDRIKFQVSVTPQTAIVSDMARAVIRRAEQYDLLVVGVREPFLRRFGRLSTAETVAKMSEIPLVMVKAATGLTALARRII